MLEVWLDDGSRKVFSFGYKNIAIAIRENA